MAIKEMHIFDMDGTLVDSSHRYRSEVRPDGSVGIDLDYWRENEDRCLSDTLLPLANVYKMLRDDPEHYVVIATARVFCENCWVFLRENLGLPNRVISRKPNDTRKGVDMKLAGIRPLLNLRNFQDLEAITVYEDNLDYLQGLTSALNAKGVFVPSNQGY